jgi:hypothetical protein
MRKKYSWGGTRLASPIVAAQVVGQALELKPAVARPGHCCASLCCPLLENGRLDAALEIGMHFGFRQSVLFVDMQYSRERHPETACSAGR